MTSRPEITPEIWRCLEPLFREAIDLEPAVRDAYLAEACSDPTLRAHLAALLAAHEEGPGGDARLDVLRAVDLLSDPAPDLEPGSAVGPYRAVRLLGRGGMGVVYLARDPRLNRDVALKLLPSSLLPGDDGSRAFEEARLASALDHPNVQTVHDVGETDEGARYIAMAYYGGETLAERIRRGAMPEGDAVRIVRGVLDGLSAAHRRGIVHRDIKPSNIAVSEDGIPKILDFGIACAMGNLIGREVPTVGTLAYMSPEQTRGGALDGRSDLWSVGVVLHEMLAGERPFRGDSREAVVREIREGAPLDLAATRPDVSASTAAAVASLLEKRPEDRPATAAAALALLPLPGSRTGRRSRALGMVAAAMLFIIAAAWAGTRLMRPDAPAASSSPLALAVLPWVPTAEDSALGRLGRDLAVTVGRSLDGVVGSVADPQSVLALVPPRGARLDAREGARIAHRLGAERFLLGSVVRAGPGQVRIDATLLDAAGAPISRVAVSGPADEIVALSDSLTFALLRGTWGESEGVDTHRLTALTTESITALRAYLQGEEAAAAGDMSAAAEAFGRAIAHDSTFWYAYYRYAYARRWQSLPVEVGVYATIERHVEDFPLRDRPLVLAWLSSGSERLSLLRDATRGFPGYWPAWFELGEFLVHSALYLGGTVEETREAFERATALNPGLAVGAQHLMWMTVREGDAEATRTQIAILDSLEAGDPGGRYGGALDYYRALAHLIDSGGALPDSMLEGGARIVAGMRHELPESVAIGLSRYGFHRAQLDLSGRVRELSEFTEVRAAALLGQAAAWAARGAWDSALMAMEAYAGEAGKEDAALLGYRLAVAGHWLGAVDTVTARAWRLRARARSYSRSPEVLAELAWLDGVLSSASGDVAGTRTARARLAEIGGQAVDGESVDDLAWLDRSLAAFELGVAGQGPAAADRLLELEREIAGGPGPAGVGRRHPFLNGLNRLAAARWADGAGRPEALLWSLNFHGAIFPEHLYSLAIANIALAAPAILERAMLYEATGEPGLAERDYRTVLSLWDAPDPELESDVAEARERLAALVRARG